MTLRGAVSLLVTWPYYWTLTHFTISPLTRIVRRYEQTSVRGKAVQIFFKSKLHESRLVSGASALSAAASIGVLSWAGVEKTCWVAFAVWYLSLLLAIFSMILGAQQFAVLSYLFEPRERMASTNLDFDHLLAFVGVRFTQSPRLRGHFNPDEALRASSTATSDRLDLERDQTIAMARSTEDRAKVEMSGLSDLSTTVATEGDVGKQSNALPLVRLSRNMTFVWQCPTMLMAWSWVMWMLGLSLHATQALNTNADVGNDRKVAFSYLVSGILVAAVFGWCSFWLYRSAYLVEKDNEDDLEA